MLVEDLLTLNNILTVGLYAYIIMPNNIYAILFEIDFDPEPPKKTLDDFSKFTWGKMVDFCMQRLLTYYAKVLRKQANDDHRRRYLQPIQRPTGIFTHDFA